MNAPSRRKLVGTGWKMNHTIPETESYIDALRNAFAEGSLAGLDIFVLPPFTALAAAVARASGMPIGIGAQNVHWAESGAWTGEISARMLADIGCRYVALAHSERLENFGETYDAVNRKLDIALRYDLTPILCIGETAEDKAAGKTDEAIAQLIETAFAGEASSQLPRIVLAYEPRWAIDGPAAADPAYVAERLVALRARLGHLFGEDAAEATRLVYGGSVTGRNAAELAAVPECDGLFVGRHAWAPSGLIEIARIVAASAHNVHHQNKEHAS